MNWSLITAILFYGLILLFFIKNRKKFVIQGKIFAIYRTKLGLKLMDRIANAFRKPLKVLSYLSILVGFVGMAFIFFWLIKGTYSLLFIPDAAPAVAPVLPGIKVPGLPTLGFWHWIVAIFIVAVVHEMCHGIFARVFKIKLRSSGFAFLGPILAAFVEPDEKVMKKRSSYEQLSILSAGPFSNIVLAFLFLGIFVLLLPGLFNVFYVGSGVEVNSILSGMPMEKTGIEAPFIIEKINGIETLNIQSFLDATEKIKPNEKIILKTDKGVYEVLTAVNPEDNTKGYIGVSDFVFKTNLRESWTGYEWLGKSVNWFNVLIMWLFIVNLGIGLFNLLPLGPVDGGRMFQILALGILKDEKKSFKVWSGVSKFCLLLIFVNLLPYIIKLFSFIVNLV